MRDLAGMIELQTLGGLDLRGHGGACIQSVLAQPKRTALLLYLALARPRGMHQRETLTGLFWAEMDGERARKALRQALYYLRGSLGEDALLSIGDAEVGVSRERLWCDAVEMERALAEDRPEDALDLYAGELLPGFYVEDAPGFERWLEAEREYLRGRAAAAAWRIAAAREIAGDGGGAAKVARRAAALSPADETVVRRLMELLERVGDRAAAIRAYEAFAWRLEQEFELKPSAETRALADAIRNQGGQKLITVDNTEPVPAPGTASSERNREQPLPPIGEAYPPHPGRRVLVTALVFALIASIGWYMWRELARSSESVDDPGRPAPSLIVAILPFHVSTSDSALAGLDEGMVDLLATRMDFEDEARVVAPRTAIAAWRASLVAGSGDLDQHSALSLASRLEAGRVVLGSVIGTSANLTLTASLQSVPDGHMLASAEVTGSVDSLIPLVDRLAVRLLGGELGMREDRLASLTSTSPPAVRAYMAGLSAHRRGSTDTAAMRFEQALQHDSTFALAALGRSVSLDNGWTRYPPEMRVRAKALAWAAREQLTPRDRLRLLSHLGPRYPEWTPPGEYIAFLEDVLERTRDDPELWFALGNALFLGGAHLAIQNWRERSARALHRAIQLDPSHPSGQGFLLRLAIEARDTAKVRELTEFNQSHPEFEQETLWYAEALSQGDFSTMATRHPLENFGEQPLRRIVMESVSFGIAVQDAERALAILLERAAGRAERDRTLMLARELALNRGRPGDARLALDELQRPGRPAQFRRERVREYVYYALYWDGSSTAGAVAASELALTSGGPLAADLLSRNEQMHDLCTLEQWRLARGEMQTVVQSVARLRQSAVTINGREAARMRACAALLEAMLASLHGRTNIEALNRLDSLHIAALPDLGNEDIWVEAGNLVIARLHAANGDFHGALGALRRRGEPSDQKILLSTLLREEGRIAALAGDAVGAIRAYRHYLVLRSEPEPHLRAEAARTASELNALLQNLSGASATGSR